MLRTTRQIEETSPSALAALAKILVNQPNLYQIIIRKNLRWIELTQEELREIENLLKVRHSTFNVCNLLNNSLHHPTLKEVLELKKLNKLTDLLVNSEQQNVRKALDNNAVSSEEYIQIIQQEKNVIEYLNYMLSQHAISDLLLEKKLSLIQLTNFTDTQKKTFSNEKIMNLLVTGIMTVQQAVSLTCSERDKLTSPHIYHCLYGQEVSVTEALDLPMNLSSSQIKVYLSKKLASQKTILDHFPQLANDALEKFAIFEANYLEYFFINDSKDFHLHAILALSDVERIKLSKTNMVLLDLVFTHKSMSLVDMLRLDQEELNFIEQAWRHPDLRAALRKGKFREIYKPVSIKLPESAADRVIDLDEKQPAIREIHTNSFLRRLTRYIERIESNTLQDGSTNFKFGFCLFFRESRAANREGNYRLAKELLNILQVQLNAGESPANAIKVAFDETVINSRSVTPGFSDRGINSSDLYGIIHDARSYLEELYSQTTNHQHSY